MVKRAGWIPCAAVALVLGACASPAPLLVTLPATPQPAVTVSDESPATTVLVRRVTLPRYLEDYSIVLGRQGNTLIVSREAEWAERMPDAVTRVLRDALSQRLGASRVLLPRERRVPDADLFIEFVRLDASDDVLLLDARWSFVCTGRGRSAHAGRTHLRTPLDTTTPAAVASVTTNALGQFADVLARETWCDGDSRAAAQ